MLLEASEKRLERVMESNRQMSCTSAGNDAAAQAVARRLRTRPQCPHSAVFALRGRRYVATTMMYSPVLASCRDSRETRDESRKVSTLESRVSKGPTGVVVVERRAEAAIMMRPASRQCLEGP